MSKYNESPLRYMQAEKPAANQSETDKEEETEMDKIRDMQLKILHLLPDELLIQELHSRGFEGSLSVTKEYKL